MEDFIVDSKVSVARDASNDGRAFVNGLHVSDIKSKPPISSMLILFLSRSLSKYIDHSADSILSIVSQLSRKLLIASEASD